MPNPHVTFPVSRESFRKVTLPPSNQYKVAAADVLIHGRVMSQIRRKGLFLGSISPILPRWMTVTRQGFLVIYNSEQKGCVVDLRDAKKLKTNTLGKAAGTQLELKLPWGAVRLFVVTREAISWIRAYTHFSGAATGEMRQLKAEEVPPAVAKEEIGEVDVEMPPPEEMDGNSSEEEEEDSSEDETTNIPPLRTQPLAIHQQHQQPKKKPAPPPVTPKLPRSSSAVCWRRPASPLPPPTSQLSEPTADLSIRQGTLSVATLRNILERKTTLDRAVRARRNALFLPRGPLLPPAVAGGGHEELRLESEV